MAEQEANLDKLKIDLEQEEGSENEPELTVAEEKAMDDGWRPEEEWEGDSADWVSAKEFNFRGELMSRISSQTGQLTNANKEIDRISKALNVLGEHHKKTAETEHKRILTSLKKEKALALEDGDSEGVVEIDDKIQDLKDSKKEEAAQVKEDKEELKDAAAEVPKEITKWLNDPKNDWYHKQPVLKGAANAIWDDYMNENPEADYTDVIKHMDKTIREEMPHKFEGTKRTSKVTESDGGRKRTKTKFTKKDLSEDQLEVAKTFVDTGIFSNVQEYVNELVENGDLN